MPAKPSERDPKALRAEAQEQRKIALGFQNRSDGLQKLADGAGQRALDLEDEANRVAAAQPVVPFSRREPWGSMVIVDALGDAEILRSADPSAVEREAVAAEQARRTQPASQARKAKGKKAAALVAPLWREVMAERRAKRGKTGAVSVAEEVSERLGKIGTQLGARAILNHRPDDA